jgi:hypothetical protein
MTDKMTAEQALDAVHDLIGDPGGIADSMDLMYKLKQVESFLSGIVQGNAALTAPRLPDGLEGYEAGLLNDYGGGNVSWWHDYIRYEVDKANDWWRQQVEAENPAAPAPADELATLRERVKVLEDDLRKADALLSEREGGSNA